MFLVYSGGGYGFGSVVDGADVVDFGAVGALDATALAYDVPGVRDDVSGDAGGPLGDVHPGLEMGSYSVLEDGNVVVAMSVSPESAGGNLEIVISDIPAGWHVSDAAFDASGTSIGEGAFDAAAGTWTMTLQNGSSLNGGPVFIPPANSDTDALNLSVTVREHDPATGRTGSVTTQFDIITDAVADGAGS